MVFSSDCAILKTLYRNYFNFIFKNLLKAKELKVANFLVKKAEKNILL